MKIRILSDLHIDVNSKYPLELKNNNDFTIIAGDISGDPELSSQWIDKNIKEGLFVAGNHIVYNDKLKAINDFKKELSSKYTIHSKITFMDILTNTHYKEINGIIFIGTTLYTDYKLNANNDEEIRWNMGRSQHGLNDFRYGKVWHNGQLDELMPLDYKQWCEESMERIKEVVEQHPDKPVVIITHHCPSFKSISDRYKNSILNSSFANDFDKFIEEHKNIKCWICGHVHHRDTYNIGQCKVIQNPRGYESHNEVEGFTPNFFLDTDTWEITKKQYRNKQWTEQRKADQKAFEEWYKKYGGLFI